VIVFALIVPLGFSLYYSTTDWAGFGDHAGVGLENYETIFTDDPVFWRSLRNVLPLMAVTIFVQNPIAFALRWYGRLASENRFLLSDAAAAL